MRYARSRSAEAERARSYPYHWGAKCLARLLRAVKWTDDGAFSPEYLPLSARVSQCFKSNLHPTKVFVILNMLGVI